MPAAVDRSAVAAVDRRPVAAANHRAVIGWMVLVLGGLLGGLRQPAKAQGPEIPDPPIGQSPQTVLAVLDYNRNLCDRVAGKVIERWQALGESPGAVESIRQYLVDEELSELAAGRAATDVVRRLMKTVRSESNQATADSLTRIGDLIQDLCDTVALPTPPQVAFEDKLRDTLDRIEKERTDLGSLLVVTDEQLRELLSAYLPPIQLAGIEAHDEYLDYLESIKPKASGPTLEQLVQAWHQRYQEATRPTKVALGKFLQARQRNDVRALRESCSEIINNVIPLLREDEVFMIPTQQLPVSAGIRPVLLPPLQRAYREIRDVAVNCKAGRSREVGEHFSAMEEELQKAARALSRYSLTP